MQRLSMGNAPGPQPFISASCLVAGAVGDGLLVADFVWARAEREPQGAGPDVDPLRKRL
jgi:hypothetical protein